MADGLGEEARAEGAAPAPEPAVAESPARGSGLLRRTLTGLALAVVVGGLLFATSVLDSGLPVLQVASLVTFVAIVEVSMMGRLVRLGLPVVLTFPLVAVVFLENAALRGEGVVDLPAPSVQFSLEWAWVVCVATIANRATRLTTTRPIQRQAALLVLVLLLMVALALVAQQGFVTEAVLTALAPVAVLAVGCALYDLRTPADRAALLARVGLAAWLVLPLPALVQVWRLYAVDGLVALIVLSKIGDVAGYYFGRAFGASHPFPRISPGKTTAGCVASLVAATVCGAALAVAGVLPAARSGALAAGGGLLAGALAGAVTNLAAQAGDLLESALKRASGVKDSSSWLGASGGVLDVIDSLLISVPVAVLLWPLLF